MVTQKLYPLSPTAKQGQPPIIHDCPHYGKQKSRETLIFKLPKISIFHYVIAKGAEPPSPP